jgi:hypothetical protein
MKHKILFLLQILLLISCKSEVVDKYDIKIGNNIIHRKCIYSDKRDTLNYQQIDYYSSGELLDKAIFKNGKMEGEFVQFNKNGSILKRAHLQDGKINGIFQLCDSIGGLAREEYYINGTIVLYSACYHSKDNRIQKQIFYMVKSDSAFALGSLVRKGDSIQREVSRYAIIEGDDTVKTSNYCFKIKVFFKQTPKTIYKTFIGTPDINLNINKVDTTFISTKNEILICNYKLVPGLNHVFGVVYALNDDSSSEKGSFFFYKDVFLNPKR